MSRGMSRAQRLKEMERLYLERAFSDIELAQRLGVDRTIVYRDRKELEENLIPFIEDPPGKYRIDRRSYLTHVRLNIREALSLYLAARRASQQVRSGQKPMATALEKLALAMRQPMTERLVSSAEAILATQADELREKVFDVVAHAWVDGLRLRVRYQGLTTRKPYWDRISPYLIEPSPWSDAVYVIGPSDALQTIVAYRMDRIQKAFITTEAFHIPEDFDEDALLRYAWGVWRSEEAPQMVVLRFAPGPAAKRLLESRWHPLEEVQRQEDGGVLWRAPIAEWREMLPWIRGWGADVEVIGPEALRETMMKEIEKMAMLYGISKISSNDNLIAHIRQDGQKQLLTIHLSETSQLAEDFASKIGFPEIGKIVGLLHDFGKASKEFQDYLHSAAGLKNPDEDVDYVDYRAKKGKIDHSTAGAQLIYEKLANRGQQGKILAQFLALTIASHHSGLVDCLKPDGTNNFIRRIEKPDEDTHLLESRKKLTLIEKELDRILATPIEQKFFQMLKDMKEVRDSRDTLNFKYGLLARFLLSCLLEADRLNTADFEFPGNKVIRNYGSYVPWEILIERLEAKFAEFANKTAQMKVGSPTWKVNQLRAQVAQYCLNAAEKPKGIYQLTVPTGGGKTLASLRFALHHAQRHAMERIFYIVPYITIIEQNADTARAILETPRDREKIVLEHHSNLTPEKETHRQNLLAENWDAPIVFTTQVQFLEALFGSGTRNARRMHQLANSVIIFDEVQTMPIKVTEMFTTALRFLTHDCGATVMLCTATQPPFDKLDTPYRRLNITPEQHIVPIQNEQELFRKLKRVQVHDERKPDGWTHAEIVNLAEQALQEKESVLVVVNTRASARALYEEIKARSVKAALYHLSTNMCAAHRKDKLNEIKTKLEAREPVICVSTQLIEAGVDIDFGAVIRALAGLDSITQSAGRCNRHGARKDGGKVWIINPQEENLASLPDIKIGRAQAQRVLDDFKGDPAAFDYDPIGLQAVAMYYHWYYTTQKDKMNYPVDKNSSVGRDDNLFNLLSMNTLSVKNYRAIHHKDTPKILLKQSFRTANGEFRVIDSHTRGVIVPYQKGKQLITELCSTHSLEGQRLLIKRTQRYSVNLFDHQLRKLYQAGAIYEVQKGSGIFYLDDLYYSDEFGWTDDPSNTLATLII